MKYWLARAWKGFPAILVIVLLLMSCLTECLLAQNPTVARRPEAVDPEGKIKLSPPVVALSAKTSVSYRIGEGIIAPKLNKKVEPRTSPQALAARIQGNLVLSIVITKEGRTTEVEVLSPLGYGLDEKAIQAVGEWASCPRKKTGNQ